MMMYEGLCFAQWSMTLMSNAPFGCLASLHFSAFAFNVWRLNIKRGGWWRWWERKRREERGWRINMASRFLRKRIKQSNLRNMCVCSLGQWLCAQYCNILYSVVAPLRVRLCLHRAVLIHCYLLVPCQACHAVTWPRSDKAESLPLIMRTWGQRHSRIWQTPPHFSTPVTSHPYEPPP